MSSCSRDLHHLRVLGFMLTCNDNAAWMTIITVAVLFPINYRPKMLLLRYTHIPKGRMSDHFSNLIYNFPISLFVFNWFPTRVPNI